MATQPTDQDITSRRGFLKALAVTAAAAAATGSGAAIWVTQREPDAPVIAVMSDRPSSAVPSAAVPTAVAVAAGNSPGFSPLVQELAAAQSENSRLQGLLEAAQARIEALEVGLTDRTAEQDDLLNRLTTAEGRAGMMAGLVALYERLDAVDVGTTVREGLGYVGSAIGDLFDDVPNVAEQLADGRRALSELDAEIPLVNGARFWLLLQITRLQNAWNGLEQMLAAVADNVGPMLTMLADWAQKVMGWLPFGLGAKTADVIRALDTLLAELPTMINGSQLEVAAPLELWLGRVDDDAIPLRDRVITPLREKALTSAQQHIDKSVALRGRYREVLEQPTTAALDAQQQLRREIEAYRAQNQL